MACIIIIVNFLFITFTRNVKPDKIKLSNEMQVSTAMKAQSVRLLTVLYTPARVVTRPADYTDLITTGLITTHAALCTHDDSRKGNAGADGHDSAERAPPDGALRIRRYWPIYYQR
jgi:hypothetical protein